jgi:hypothetical protein
MKLSLKHAQGIVFNDRTRFRVLVTGRRFGKTYLALAEILRAAAEKPGLYWYLAPTYAMAKDIAWEPMKAMVPEEWRSKRPNETELSIKLVNGSVIQLKGVDKPDSLVGRGPAGAVLDECALYEDEKVWKIGIFPSLGDSQGWALFTTTIRRGFRAQWFLDLYEFAKKGEDENWKAFSFTTLEGDNFSKEEFELHKKILDEKTFNQEYLAKLEDDDGRVAVSFGPENIEEVEDDDSYPLLIGIDFNIDPFCALCMVKVPVKVGDESWHELHVFDEIMLKDATTWDMADVINEKYGEDRKKRAYPDPTGNARKTSSAGATDHSILRRAGIRVISPKSPWRIRDKVTAVNTALKDATGRRRTKINPRCTELIKSLKNLMYDEKTGLPDKTQGLDHFFDAFGYPCLMVFNLATPPAFESTGYQIYGAAEEAKPPPPAAARPTMFSYARRGR